MADFCDFKKILSYRSVWMALAALWVVYHHISLTPLCAFLQVLKSCGAGGVDIFVFASGLGFYHSLKKNPDTLIFIKKRLIKIVPAYYLCVTPWVIFDGIRLGTTVQGVVATYLGVDSLFGLGLQTLWYVNGLVVYYILVLFFVPLCLRGNFKTKLLGFCFCILLTVPFLGDTMRLMLFARVPLLYLGAHQAYRPCTTWRNGGRHHHPVGLLLSLSRIFVPLRPFVVAVYPDRPRAVPAAFLVVYAGGTHRTHRHPFSAICRRVYPGNLYRAYVCIPCSAPRHGCRYFLRH